MSRLEKRELVILPLANSPSTNGKRETTLVFAVFLVVVRTASGEGELAGRIMPRHGRFVPRQSHSRSNLPDQEEGFFALAQRATCFFTSVKSQKDSLTAFVPKQITGLESLVEEGRRDAGTVLD